jgi:hypothetical protein
MAMMVEKGTQVTMSQIPACDLPHDNAPNAYADARMLSGPHAGRWAYLCREHFTEYGCRLGTGFGQELVEV